MEGAFRPGHFNGVAIVVHKLFDIVTPDRAYFGEKDYQQLMIIKAMVNHLQLPVQIIACPISREIDGLAMSSRNARLSKELRSAAPFIYRQLQLAVSKATTMTAENLERFIADSFESHENLHLEYFVIADGDTLQPVRGTITPNAYGFIAVFAGDIRLIDNIRLI
jgi:pantoate--beta-alanine ligase